MKNASCWKSKASLFTFFFYVVFFLALIRLGGGKAGLASSSASQRWKTKKQKAKEEREKCQEKSSANKEDLLKLTGHADMLLCLGNLEIYHDTFEKLSFKVKAATKEVEKKTSSAFDMFAEDEGSVENKKEDKEKEGENKKENREEVKEEKPLPSCKWYFQRNESLHLGFIMVPIESPSSPSSYSGFQSKC